MIASQTKTIDGHEFTVTQLPGMRSLKMLNRLTRVLGPGLASFAAEVQKAQQKAGSTQLRGMDALLSVDLAEIGTGLGKLFAQLSDDELESITRALLDGAMMRSDSLTGGKNTPVLDGFDLLMRGRVWTVLRLLVFAVEVNYGDFFSAMGLRATAQGPTPASGSR